MSEFNRFYDRFISDLRLLAPDERPAILNALVEVFCFSCGEEPAKCECPDWELGVSRNGDEDE